MLEHVVGEEAEDLQLVEELAALIDCACAICIAIEQEAEVVVATAHPLQNRIDMRSDRLGVHATEPWVSLASHLLDHELPPSEEAADPASASAVHRVDEDAPLHVRQGGEVKVALDIAAIAWVGVVALDQAGRLGIGEGAALELRSARLGNEGLDALEEGGARRGAARCLHLEAVIQPRIVACGDHHTHRGTARDHLIRGHLRGGCRCRIRHRDPMGEENLCRCDGEIF